MIFSPIGFQRRALPRDGLNLNHFLAPVKLRSLYRKILRETRYLGTNPIRRETISWIRYEFVRPMTRRNEQLNHQDLIAQLNRQLKEIQNQSVLIGGQFDKLRGGRVNPTSTK